MPADDVHDGRRSDESATARLARATERPLSRREMLRAIGAGVLAVPTLSALVACPPEVAPIEPDRSLTGSTPSSLLDPDVEWDDFWARQELTGLLDFANWPRYIDRRRDDSHPSLDLFEERTGIRVNYYTSIRDTARFVEEIRPALESGATIDYDLFVISNGPELSELISSGLVTPLDHSRLPNFEQYAGPLARGPVWDPDNAYSVAWQSGFTGIAYTPEAVEALGRQPTSVQDLWDPALAGRVGMMSDVVELGSAGLLAIGVDPSVSTPDNWLAAAEMLRVQKETVRPRYYDQGYLDALAKRDTWATLAWSGDIFQMNNLGRSELHFVVPSEGAMLWTDNLVIPRNASHPLDALTLIDFVYQPEIAAMIADWVGYVCPVPAAAAIIEEQLGHPEVAQSPLVFPGPELLGKGAEGDGGTESPLGSLVRNYYVYAGADEYQAWADVFGPVLSA